jgi:hypothetical protein
MKKKKKKKKKEKMMKKTIAKPCFDYNFGYEQIQTTIIEL